MTDSSTVEPADRQIASVVIGRNEGNLLKLSLGSVQTAGIRLVYVDSGSTDGSVDLAFAAGIPTIELDASRPFSAARGRNEGVREVQRRWPEMKYVIFLDGDCELDPGFPDAALETFEKRPDCAIVTGHLRERDPHASVYNRLCAIEWRSSAGKIEDARLGGIMAARISAFSDVSGFRDNLIAGEEPDLAVRLGRAGYSIFKIDVPMAVHDAQMLSFGQWWARAVRGGHGIAQLCEHHLGTGSRVGAREVRSALFWGFALPVLSLLLVWPTRGFSLAFFGGYGLLAWRTYKYYRGTGLSVSDARLVTRFILYSKFAEFVGIIRYYVRVRRRVRN